MQPFTREQAIGWCAERGISVSDRDELQFDLPKAYTLTTSLLPGRAILGQAAVLAYKANEEPFEGGLLYVRNENEQPERWESFWGLTEATLGLLRQSVDWRGNLSQHPAQHFAPHDAAPALAFVTQLLLFDIDAYFVPEKADYIAFINHDEVISLFCRDASWHDIMSKSLARKSR